MPPEKIVESEKVKAFVGKQIQAERKRQDRTLDEVAELTGLSSSLLSQIEKAQVNLSIANLWKICQALDVEAAQLFPSHRSDSEFELIRAPERETIVPIHAVPESPGYSYRHIGSIPPHIEVFLVEIMAIPEEEIKFNTHQSIELVYILSGKLKFISNRFTANLYTGDSLKFPAKYPHAYQAIDEPAQLIAFLYSCTKQVDG